MRRALSSAEVALLKSVEVLIMREPSDMVTQRCGEGLQCSG